MIIRGGENIYPKEIEDFIYTCLLYTSPVDGLGHFIHTYKCDGDPIPSYEGDPTPVKLEGTIDELTAVSYTHLDVYKRQCRS